MLESFLTSQNSPDYIFDIVQSNASNGSALYKFSNSHSYCYHPRLDGFCLIPLFFFLFSGRRDSLFLCPLSCSLCCWPSWMDHFCSQFLDKYWILILLALTFNANLPSVKSNWKNHFQLFLVSLKLVFVKRPIEWMNSREEEPARFQLFLD